MSELLSVHDLHVYYGSIHAVKGVSFEVHEGEVVTLIGANGSRKIHHSEHCFRSSAPPLRLCPF